MVDQLCTRRKGGDLSKLFAGLLADAAAVLGDGCLLDEVGLVGGGQRTAGDLVRVLLGRSASGESTALSGLEGLRTKEA